MAHWQLRHTYGHGAAKLTLAPTFTPSPYARPDSMRVNARLALRGEHPARLAARVLGGSAGAVVSAIALTLLLAPLFTQPPDDDQGTQIVMVTPQPRLEEEELLPPPAEPEPVLPEPQPVEVAQEPPPEPEPLTPEPPPEPVKVVKKAPPPPPLPAMPAPVEPPKEFVPTPAPVRVAREPVKKPPAVVSIDPLSPAPAIPSTDPAPLPPPKRTAARPPAATQRALPALADFAPIGEPAPRGAPAALPSRAVRTNVVARNSGPSRPLAFAAAAPAAPPAAFDPEGTRPALATRSAAPRPHTPSASPSSRPQSLGFAAAATPAATETSSAAVGRTERAAPQRTTGSAQNENLAAVPLGSLAACASDREEDQGKMALLTAVRGRTECSSAAGRYRFVETKNLNAFLMWIERAPGRPAVDRCVELRLALECLGG